MNLALFDFEPIEQDGVSYLIHNGLAEMRAEKLAGWEQKRQAGIDRAKQRERERLEKKKDEQIPNERKEGSVTQNKIVGVDREHRAGPAKLTGWFVDEQDSRKESPAYHLRPRAQKPIDCIRRGR